MSSYKWIGIASIVGALYFVHKSQQQRQLKSQTGNLVQLAQEQQSAQQFGHGLDEFYIGYFPGASPDPASEELAFAQKQYRELGTHLPVYNGDDSSGTLGFVQPGPEQL